jgi:rhodanese-related sulfurtransferase
VSGDLPPRAEGLEPAAEDVDVSVAHALWVAGDLVVDVRTPDEYASGHIAGAVNVPLDAIAFRIEQLSPGQVLTVCSMGNRSRRAAERFARLGRPAMSLRGGTKAWAAAGLPVVAGPEPGERTRTGLRDRRGRRGQLRGWLRRAFGR